MSLETRVCFAWRTDRPLAKRPRVSPYFTYQNSDWCLCMNLNEKAEYFIQLERKLSEKNFHSFEVTTYIESVDERNKPFFSRKIIVLQSPVRIWHFPESAVLKKIPEVMEFGEFVVVCVFHQISDSTLEARGGQQINKNPSKVSSNSPCLENLSADLECLLQNNTFTDVKLKCGDQVIPAHKAFLAARSEVFAAMFRNKMLESETGTVDISDMEPQVLDIFLKYLYSGRILDISVDILPSLYETSNKYSVQTLRTECAERMVKGLTKENYLEFLTLADKHEDLTFKDKIMSFIYSNSGEIFKQEAWLTFCDKAPNLAIKLYQK